MARASLFKQCTEASPEQSPWRARRRAGATFAWASPETRPRSQRCSTRSEEASAEFREGCHRSSFARHVGWRSALASRHTQHGNGRIAAHTDAKAAWPKDIRDNCNSRDSRHSTFQFASGASTAVPSCGSGSLRSTHSDLFLADAELSAPEEICISPKRSPLANAGLSALVAQALSSAQPTPRQAGALHRDGDCTSRGRRRRTSADLDQELKDLLLDIGSCEGTCEADSAPNFRNIGATAELDSAAEQGLPGQCLREEPEFAVSPGAAKAFEAVLQYESAIARDSTPGHVMVSIGRCTQRLKDKMKRLDVMLNDL